MGKVRWNRFHLDPVLVVCFAALFAFPIAASVVASGEPVDPESSAPPGRARADVAPLRDLPAFSDGSPLERRLRAQPLLSDERRMRAALATSLRELLGARSTAVLELVRGKRTLTTERVDGLDVYPFRYRQLDPLLDAVLARTPGDRQARRANDVGALFVLAAANHAEAFPQAARAAFALLARARRGGDCVAERNLAFLVALDPATSDAVLRAETRRARRACPGDPTPAWMLGQVQSQRVAPSDAEHGSAPFQTFRRLQRSAPASPLGWAGEADTELRLAYQREALHQPFAARARFRRALRLYRHAERLQRDPGLAAGAARALAGLHEYGAAVGAQRRAVAGRSGLAPLAARLVEYLQRDRRFAEAAAAARPLAAAPAFASGRALVFGEPFHAEEQIEDAATPLSIGVDRMRPVKLTLGTAASQVLPAVTDLSFIPEFRTVNGLTGYDRWCPSWSLPRDLLLDGRPRAALAALPRRIVDITGGFGCDDVALSTLRATVELALGRRAPALARLADAGFDADEEVTIFPERSTPAGELVADVFEAQQNIWRFAGRLDRAADVARAWVQRIPDDPRAADRLGEIAFLAKDYPAAARAFARSLRLTRLTVRGWTAQEAFALLKRGTALARTGRRSEAVAVLDRADEIALRAEAHGDEIAPVVASYYARVQAGDALLRAHDYRAAAEAYEAAREHERALEDVSQSALTRPEALHNNQSIAAAKLGHRKEAIDAARTALAADPESPLFLETAGYALRTAGRLAEAERSYRAAVRSEPRAFNAWNDLGVVLARRDRLDEAVAALRRAVGARADYALGWFNLGVAQGRRGAAHMLASQGALGRAFGLDEGLRDRKRELTTDDAIVFTELDLSKPLPPRWSSVDVQERSPVAAAGFALLVLLGLRLGRRMLASRFGGDLAGRLIDPLMQLSTRYPRVPVYTPSIVAALATVATFAVGLLRPGAGGLADAVVLIVGLVVLIVGVGRGRALAARDAGVTLHERGWTPGIALGAAAAAVGTAWAPLPVAQPSAPAPAVHWIGPALTAIAAFGLLVVGVWLNIPSTHALAAVALVMTASLLTPTKPLDGGFVATGTAGVATGLALLGGGLFFLLGVG